MLGAVLRIVRFVVSKWNHPLLLNDSLYYSAQARQLAHGVWFHEVFSGQPGAEHGPLTSTLMGFVSWGNDPFNRQRMVTVACGIATVAVIGLVGRRVGGNRVGLIAAAVAAVYPNLWINDGLVMSESVSCLMVALALWALLTWTYRPQLRAAALIGLTIGLGALARSELVLFIPAAAVVMWVIARRAGARATLHVVVADRSRDRRDAPVDGLQRRSFRRACLLDDQRRSGMARRKLLRHLLRPGTGRLVAVVSHRPPGDGTARGHLAALGSPAPRSGQLRAPQPEASPARRVSTGHAGRSTCSRFSRISFKTSVRSARGWQRGRASSRSGCSPRWRSWGRR